MSRLMWIGVTLIAAGITSGILEQVVYGGVDENNVLQESFFLPLAFILIFFGSGLILAATGCHMKRKNRGPRG